MIAKAFGVVGATPQARQIQHIADRWIYVFMSVLFVATVLAGFVPDSIRLLNAVDAGQRPPLPPILHAHAIIMGSWLLLLLAQTTLMATGRGALHKQLGLAATVLVPLIAFGMIGVVHSTWSWIASIPASAMPPESLNQLKSLVSNILLEQTRMLVLFPALVTWAILARRKDPETHKRLMILASVLPLPAAVDRITWLPTTLPDSPTSIHLFSLLLLLPVLIYDIWRRRRIHRAYVIGLTLNLPFVITSHFLWGSPWWLVNAPRIVGIQGW